MKSKVFMAIGHRSDKPNISKHQRDKALDQECHFSCESLR